VKELSKYKIYLMVVQEVTWDRGDTKPSGKYTFSYARGNDNHELSTGFCVYKIIISAVMRVEFVCDRMSYLILIDHWCDIIVLNFHAPTDNKIDDIKDSFLKELGRISINSPNTM
jgi:hypothetical protein